MSVSKPLFTAINQKSCYPPLFQFLTRIHRWLRSVLHCVRRAFLWIYGILQGAPVSDQVSILDSLAPARKLAQQLSSSSLTWQRNSDVIFVHGTTCQIYFRQTEVIWDITTYSVTDVQSMRRPLDDILLNTFFTQIGLTVSQECWAP